MPGMSDSVASQPKLVTLPVASLMRMHLPQCPVAPNGFEPVKASATSGWPAPAWVAAGVAGTPLAAPAEPAAWLAAVVGAGPDVPVAPPPVDGALEHATSANATT